jgi:cobalt-zinc-cadmium resistance protein CzcA
LVIIISAYIPLFGLERVERRLFTPMAYTVCYALIGSLLLTLTLIPALATYVFGGKAKIRKRRFAEGQPWYGHLCRWVFQRARTVAFVLAGITLASFWLGGRLGTEFLPQLDEGVIWIRANMTAGTAIEESAAIAARIREWIRLTPEVKFVSSQTGRQDSNTEPFGPNRTEFLVALTSYSSWKSGRTKAKVVEEISARLRDRVPGVALSFTQPIIDMVTESVTGSSADLAIIFTGSDLAELRGLATKALAIVRRIRGAADSAVEQDADQAQLKIIMDREAVARFGLNVADVQNVIELAIGGRAVSTMYEEDRRFDIAVRYIAEARSDIQTIGDISIMAPNGRRVPLSQLATIVVEDGASIITRRENRRQISVRTNIRGRDQGGFAAEAQRRIAAEIVLPAGYQVAWGGQFENLSRASRRLSLIIPLTILLMFGLLYGFLESAVDAGLVLLNVPLSFFGGIVALFIRGIPLSVSAAVGFVSVFGVAVMLGVLFIADINRIRGESGKRAEDAIVDAAQSQLASRFQLILIALLGIVPAATASGIGSDIQRPMATVIFGGLISIMILAPIAMPCLYYLISRKREPGKALLPIH